jgi:hypothetical protein
MNRKLGLFFLLFGLSIGCSGSETNGTVSSVIIEDIRITSFPEKIDNSCRNGRAKIFDECANQTEIFARARLRADAEDKTVLVSYGAEWCIWCHVFDAYINGEMSKFTYTFGEAGNDERYTHTMRERLQRDVSQEAFDLKKFVSENFVIAHIDYEHSPNGDDVLSDAQAWENYGDWVPYIFVVDRNGNYVEKFNHDKNDWYRGYDRVQLLEQLKNMRSAAINRNNDLE